MSAPDPRTPQADAALLRFIERRRRRKARHRRQLILLGSTTALALVVFLVAMVSQRLSGSGPTPMATVVARPPVPATPSPRPAARPAEVAPSRSSTAAPAPTATRSPAPDTAPDTRSTPATATEPPARREPEPHTATAAGVELPAARESESPVSTAAEVAPARNPETSLSSVALVPRRVETAPTTPLESELDPATRTARWYLQTYGRVEAENRVAMVQEFYSGEQRAFWRRVLADVRQTRER
jgi:hypothetical protein